MVGTATLALSALGCGSSIEPLAVGPGPVDSPPPAPLPPTYPELNYITRDPAFTDYRPAVDVTGQRFVFERSPVGGSGLRLYLVEGPDGADPTPFTDSPLGYGAQSRPCWSWSNDRVMFNVEASGTTVQHVAIAEADGSSPTLMPDSNGLLYPQWSEDGTQVVVYNLRSHPDEPEPRTSLVPVSSGATTVVLNLNGTDAASNPVFGGFACPRGSDPRSIAYAGQPTRADWVPAVTAACPNEAGGYNQCYNYVFVNEQQGNGYSSRPLEREASVTTYDPRYQGRAPWWSPDGRYVVFESDRNGGYAIFLFDTQGDGVAVQLTDERLQAQHAKFFPAGNRIVFTVYQQLPTVQQPQPPRGIAWIDLTGYLGS